MRLHSRICNGSLTPTLIDLRLVRPRRWDWSVGIGVLVLFVMATLCHGVRANPQDQKAVAEDVKKAEEIVQKQFPVLRNPVVPPLAPLTDEVLSRAFPQHQFFALIFAQYPVARIPPEPLTLQNLFAVNKDGKPRSI